MKTVCVFATLHFANSSIEIDSIEHCAFGEGLEWNTASAFIKYCEDMYKKNCNKYKITNIVIG